MTELTSYGEEPLHAMTDKDLVGLLLRARKNALKYWPYSGKSELTRACEAELRERGLAVPGD